MEGEGYGHGDTADLAGDGYGHDDTADLAGDGNGGGDPAAGRAGPGGRAGARRRPRRGRPWRSPRSACNGWIPGSQGSVPDLRVELTAIAGVPVYGELLFAFDQQQKHPWHTVAADVFIGEGESLVVAYVAKIDWDLSRFRLHTPPSSMTTRPRSGRGRGSPGTTSSSPPEPSRCAEGASILASLDDASLAADAPLSGRGVVRAASPRGRVLALTGRWRVGPGFLPGSGRTKDVPGARHRGDRAGRGCRRVAPKITDT